MQLIYAVNGLIANSYDQYLKKLSLGCWIKGCVQKLVSSLGDGFHWKADVCESILFISLNIVEILYNIVLKVNMRINRLVHRNYSFKLGRYKNNIMNYTKMYKKKIKEYKHKFHSPPERGTSVYLVLRVYHRKREIIISALHDPPPLMEGIASNISLYYYKKEHSKRLLCRCL